MEALRGRHRSDGAPRSRQTLASPISEYLKSAELRGIEVTPHHASWARSPPTPRSAATKFLLANFRYSLERPPKRVASLHKIAALSGEILPTLHPPPTLRRPFSLQRRARLFGRCALGPVPRFWSGYKQIALRPEELIRRIRLPRSTK